MAVPDRSTEKDGGQVAVEQRRNAHRKPRAYVQDCGKEWPTLSDEEKELCREALRNLAQRADVRGAPPHRGNGQ